MSSYKEALEAAGATVHAYEEFGSYQGKWYAKITLPTGETGWLADYYGSCSGCDAFQADVGNKWNYDTHSYPPGVLEEFGSRYFDALKPLSEILASVEEDISWDLEASEAYKWLKEHEND